MAFQKFILPTLALAGLAFAQCDGDLTISSQSDATGIAGCTTYDGSITIDESVSGAISLNGVRSIDGDLICRNASNLNTLSADQINSISGTFDLQGLTTLTTLQFDSLQAVAQINWIGLPQLQALNFPRGIQRANTVYISNTQLNTLAGIELTQVASMNVNNNPYLTTINVNDLTNVTDALTFAANGRELEISFPNLQGAANLTFRDVNSVEMPSLSNVDGAMGFYETEITSFTAPNLTRTGATLAIANSPNLESLDFPSLTTVGGGFQIANNSALSAINGFPRLATVVGAIDFTGTFDVVSLPALRDVRGGSNVITTSTNQTLCQIFNRAHDNGIIKGANECATSTDVNANSTSTGSGSRSSSSGAAIAYGANVQFTGLSAFIAALLFV